MKPGNAKSWLLAAFGIAGCILVLVVTSSVVSNTGGSKANLRASQTPADLTIVGYLNLPEFLQVPYLSAASREREALVISVPNQGRLRGTTLKSRRGREYFAFYKVPYARPPFGELRFKPPQTPRRWRGIRDATKPGPQCIQKSKYDTPPAPAGSEDCLFLNLYTPTLAVKGSKSVKMPVLFYLHGGGGPYGNGTRYGAKYFMDEDVVLVTVEFRLGILGSFTDGTSHYPGNIGSKDQVFALKWIQRNIHRFGGDPTRVMIFGNSGGGGAVHSLLLSPMSTGLFSSAIMQSGNCIRDIGTPQDPNLHKVLLANEVGCDQHLENNDKLVRCLRSIDASKLVLTNTQNIETVLYKEPIPKNGDTSNTFFTDFPWNLIQAGTVNKVPLIAGDVSEESMSGSSYEYLLNENTTKALNTEWNTRLPDIVRIPDDANHTVAKRFRELYFGDKPIDNDTRVELLQLHSDAYVHSQRVSALLHRQKSGQPTYLYWLTKEPAKTYGHTYEEDFPPPYGVSHADELQYFFLYESYPEIGMDSPWFNYSETLVKMWVSFAATGKPNSPGEEWKPIALEDKGMKWYELGDELKEIEPVTKRMLLWDDYIPQLYYPSKQ